MDKYADRGKIVYIWISQDPAIMEPILESVVIIVIVYQYIKNNWLQNKTIVTSPAFNFI